MTEKRKLVLFFDLVGRTIIGEKTEETDDIMYIKNPVVVNIVPQQDAKTGQQRMALQLLPLFFREFLAAPEEGVEFAYSKKNITLTRNPVIFDFKLDIQYDQITAPPNHAAVSQPTHQVMPPPTAPAADADKKIKLFD